jgi:hypothetical protein
MTRRPEEVFAHHVKATGARDGLSVELLEGDSWGDPPLMPLG